MDMAEIIETLGRHEERITALERWEEKQNGSIQKMEDKFQSLDEKIEERFNKINNLLLTLLGGVCTSLLLLVLNLISKH